MRGYCEGITLKFILIIEMSVDSRPTPSRGQALRGNDMVDAGVTAFSVDIILINTQLSLRLPG